MPLTATEAKNRFGQVLEQAQRQPVFIEKAGRRHSVVMSAEQYDAMVAAARRDSSAGPAPCEPRSAEAQHFYEQHKQWVDEQNERFERIGVWNEEFRSW
jgi:prevent-host-death family protein